MNDKKSSRKRQQARKPARKVRMTPTGQGLTSQAGLIPVVKYLSRINFDQVVSKHMTHTRGDNAAYQLSDAILLTLVGMLGGAASMSKISAVWADSVLRKITGWVSIPVETTVHRIFKEMKAAHISQLESLNHQLRGQHWRRLLRAGISTLAIRPIHWIDVDSTVDTVCGQQEGSAKGYNPKKKGARSYHPQLAFLVETKEILQAWFRTGNAYTSNGIVEFVKQLLAHLPNQMRIVLRGDSGYFADALLELLETRGHGYLIKVKLRNLTTVLSGQSWTAVKHQPGWEQCKFEYRCDSWVHPRHFMAVRVAASKQASAQSELWEVTGYDYFCYVTTEALTPWEAHKKYGERAICETWIEEAKCQMGMGKVRTSHFLANAALFHCAVLAYNTVRWMAQLSGNKMLQQWEPETVRTYLVRVAGKLLTGNNQLTIKTPDNPLYPKVWDAWVRVGLLI